MARWKFDLTHTSTEFAVRHMMVSKVRGHFSGLEGWLEFDENAPEKSYIEAHIPVATVDTRQPDRDNHLRSADFFDAEHYPTMTFKSNSIQVTGKNTGQVTGDLTIRGVTRPVTFNLEYFGKVASPFGDTRVGFNGNTRINREDFGLTWNVALEAGGVLVGKEVEINVELEAILEVTTETATV